MSHGEETLTDAPSFREFRAMRDAAENSIDEKFRLESQFLLVVMGKLGLRPGEACHISRDWVDFEKKEITIPEFDKCTHGKDGGICGYCRDRAQKSAEVNDDLTIEEAKAQRWQPLNEQSHRTVPYGWLEEEDEIIEEYFEQNDTYSSSRSSVNRRIDRIAKATSIIEKEEVNPKALRGHAAINLANRGLGVIKLREYLGYDGYKIPIKILEEVTTDSQQGLDSLEPISTDTKNWDSIPTDVADFESGEHYSRDEIHLQFGGERFQGVSSSTETPAIFVFVGEDVGETQCAGEFTEAGDLVCTIEQDADHPRWADSIEALSKHEQVGESIHVFESLDEGDEVSYVGEFEYDTHFSREVDAEGDDEEYIIELSPANELSPVTQDELETISNSELYQKARESARSGEELETSDSAQSRLRRSEVVKEYALRVADGVCQGCEKEAPFVDDNDEPFLEVHHLHRRSDGGPDHPDNVVALCPNCHRRVHHGKEGDQFNESLKRGSKNGNND